MSVSAPLLNESNTSSWVQTQIQSPAHTISDMHREEIFCGWVQPANSLCGPFTEGQIVSGAELTKRFNDDPCDSTWLFKGAHDRASKAVVFDPQIEVVSDHPS